MRFFFVSQELDFFFSFFHLIYMIFASQELDSFFFFFFFFFFFSLFLSLHLLLLLLLVLLLFSPLHHITNFSFWWLYHILESMTFFILLFLFSELQCLHHVTRSHQDSRSQLYSFPTQGEKEQSRKMHFVQGSFFPFSSLELVISILLYYKCT